MRVIRLLVFFAAAIMFGGCSAGSVREPRFIDDIRPVPPPLRITNFNIQRRDLQDSLTRQGDNAIRLVPVFDNVSVKQTYSYRLFDVHEGSAYSLLGLQSSDVVVAADRYLIKNKDQFPAFINLLTGVDEATIEIRRNGEGRLFKYRFLPSIGQGEKKTF